VAFNGTGISLVGFCGPTYGIARISVDGAPAVTADYYREAYGSATVWSSGTLPAGPHTIEVGYSSTRNPASGGNRVSVDAVDVVGTLTQAPAYPTRYEDTDTKLAYYGGWITAGSGTAATSHYTQLAGSYALAKFDGTRITLVGFCGPTYGIANVSIDGGPAVPVDYYRPTYGTATVWTSPVLAPGVHTLRIDHTGTFTAPSTWHRVGVDALDVTGMLLQAP
jgi:hypothetical protein